jgi:hypothetical protein
MDIISPIKVESAAIERIPPPVIDRVAPPVVNGMEVPIVEVPVPRLNYPRIEVPASPQIDVPAAPGNSGTAEKTEKEKSRDLPDSAPKILQQLPANISTIPAKVEAPREEVPKNDKIMEVQIAGRTMNIPSPVAVAEASVTAVIGTSATLVTALVFNQARQAAAPVIQKLARDKFKIKLKRSKPVLHFIEEEGEVHIIQYGADGVKVLNASVSNPEQYLRDVVDADHLFEADHKIVIDENIKDRFTQEGIKRFNYFVSPKKIAKRLTARFTF